jgi:calcium-dependent protein kinase
VKVVESKTDGGLWSPLSIYKREVQFLRGLNHPNVIRFIAAYEDRKFLYIVSEKYGGGEVFDRILQQKRLCEADAASVMLQAFSAIDYIHSMGIVHRYVVGTCVPS